MNVGMMWFNDNPKTPLTAQVLEAAEYYRAKYGQNPNLCLVNPAMYEQISKEPLEGQAGKVVIRSLRSILPGHLWIGVDDKQSGK
jgi:hypothetical protein